MFQRSEVKIWAGISNYRLILLTVSGQSFVIVTKNKWPPGGPLRTVIGQIFAKSCSPLPYCSPPRCPFPIKSLALSAHVSPRATHSRVLDKSPVSALEGVPLPATSLTIKKAEPQRTDAFELWCWRRLFRVPWTERKSNQSILKEISPEYSLEGLMLKLKLQYFGHLM